MRTLEEIKDDYAREHGYDDWNEVIYSEHDPNSLDNKYDEIAIRFARSVELQVKKDCMNGIGNTLLELEIKGKLKI